MGFAPPCEKHTRIRSYVVIIISAYLRDTMRRPSLSMRSEPSSL